MRVGVVGDTRYPDPERVSALVTSLPRDVTVVVPAGSLYEQAARDAGVPFETLSEDAVRHGSRSMWFHMCNLIDSCDEVVAFFAAPSRRATIVVWKCSRSHKPLTVNP